VSVWNSECMTGHIVIVLLCFVVDHWQDTVLLGHQSDFPRVQVWWVSAWNKEWILVWEREDVTTFCWRALARFCAPWSLIWLFRRSNSVSVCVKYKWTTWWKKRRRMLLCFVVEHSQYVVLLDHGFDWNWD
jgi:hypothetical protein